jgi:hypothetical protein
MFLFLAIWAATNIAAYLQLQRQHLPPPLLLPGGSAAPPPSGQPHAGGQLQRVLPLRPPSSALPHHHGRELHPGGRVGHE